MATIRLLHVEKLSFPEAVRSERAQQVTVLPSKSTVAAKKSVCSISITVLSSGCMGKQSVTLWAEAPVFYEPAYSMQERLAPCRMRTSNVARQYITTIHTCSTVTLHQLFSLLL